MKIQWIGHAAFLLVTDDGTRIITDPYESGSYGGALGYGPIQMAADIVTISHEQHEDHNYTKAVQGDPVIIKGLVEENKDIGGINIHRVHAFHDKSKGKERGENYISIIKADGLSICHMGDLGHILTNEQIKDIGQLDVLLIPIGGVYTIGPKEATKIINQLKPRIAIPMHYKTSKCGFPLATVDEFLEGKEKIKEKDDTTIEIQADSLPQATEIVVLAHAR